jgi:hypothetical protein
VFIAHLPAGYLARHQPWVLNFVFHWTFALEIAILAAAVWYASRPAGQTRASSA